MNAKTITVALAALAVVAAIAWWALSGGADPAASSTGSGSGTSTSRSPSSGRAPDPAEEKPLEAPAPRVGPEIDGPPETPTPGSRPAVPVKPGARAADDPGTGGGGGRPRRTVGAAGGGGAGGETRPAPPGVTESVEEHRRLLITRALDYDSVFPNKGGWPKEDESRFERYPAPGAWPKVLGDMESEPSRYRVVTDVAKGIGPKSGGGFVLPEPLAVTLTTETYVTLLCRKGIAAEGIWVAKSYSTLLCQGDMAGKLFFASYATAVVDGALTGTVTAKSYFVLVVKGKFTGKIFAESYAMIQLLGGLEGELELKGSKVYVKGSVPKVAMEKVTGSGTLYVDESELGPGRHVLGNITVYVGSESLPPEREGPK